MSLPYIKTIKNKLIFYTTIAIAVYLVGCILFFTLVFPTQFKNSQKKLNSYSVSIANKDLSSVLVSTRNLYLNISDDAKMSEMFSSLYKESKMNKDYAKPRPEYTSLLSSATWELSQLLNYNSNSITAIALVCDDKVLLSTRTLTLPLVQSVEKYGDKVSFLYIPQTDNYTNQIQQNYIISFPYTISENVNGYICFFIKEPSFLSSSTSTTYILDENSCVFTNNQILSSKDECKYYDEWRNASQTITQTIGNKTFFVSTEKIDLYNWTLVNLLESNSFNKTVQRLMLLIVFIVACGIILMLF